MKTKYIKMCEKPLTSSLKLTAIKLSIRKQEKPQINNFSFHHGGGGGGDGPRRAN